MPLICWSVYMYNIIEFKALDFTDRYYYRKKPFTGTAIEYFKNGRIMNVVMLKDGIEDGLRNEYYEDGEARSRTMMNNNVIHGHYYNWYKSGQLKIESLLEYGIIIWQKHYSIDGDLEYDYHISSDEFNYCSLLKFREEKGWPIENF